jgi:hypothetical protein
MAIVISLLISAILIAAQPFLNELLKSIIPIALHAEEYMSSLTGSNWFNEVAGIFFSFGISMIVLKFLFKGFNIYIGWMDGDADADPIDLLTNFLRALVVAISFPTLYKWMTAIIEDLIDELIVAIGVGTSTEFSSIIESLASTNIFTMIVTLIFFILLAVMYIQFLVRGVEILILRIGLPFACVGLIDNDKGVFGAYIKKFYQSMLGILVQVVLCKLGISMMLSGHIFWAIACMNLSLKAPRFLSEFILAGGGGGGNFINKIYYTSNLVGSVKRAIGK